MSWAYDAYWLKFGGSSCVPDYRALNSNQLRSAELALRGAVYSGIPLTFEQCRAIEALNVAPIREPRTC